MMFARWVFGLAGVSGLLLVPPLFFFESTYAPEGPAPFFPVFFFGFVGVTSAFQVIFLLIAYDVVRFRLLMIPSVLEKAGFSIPMIMLWQQNRLPEDMLPAMVMDFALMILFAIAFFLTPSSRD